MIKETRIDTVAELMPLIADQEYRSDLDRNRSQYFYSGMPDASFKMAPSPRRNCKDLTKTLEPAILRNFAKYAVIEDPTVAQSVWRQMILGQHNGLPTRLLDWTHSALVALHFSTTEPNMENMEEHDSLVWRIDVTELHSLLPQSYRDVMERHKAEIFSVDMLEEAASSVQRYDEDMGDKSMVVIEPPSINSRIVNQYSFFSVIPSDMNDVESFLNENTSKTVKYVIDKSLRWRVRDMLDQLNISERIVYPGLEGLSRWIGRHYFVKRREGNE